MNVAPPSDQEESRLQALLRYHILDTEAEAPYDDLVELAAFISQKPIALISLIDDKRQWFKAKVGLEATSTHRDIAFCSHAILQNQIFEVPDAISDQRFADNPLVTDGPKIRFYAGTPLITHDGFALGTLCVIDTTPSQLTDSQRRALEALGRQVISQLELRLGTSELQELNSQKDTFIRLLSHDLRNAFGGISGLTQLIQQTSLSPAQLADYIDKIRTSSEQGLHLLNNLLSWSILKQTRSTTNTPVQLINSCQRATCYLNELATSKNISLNIECANDLIINVDDHLLTSTLQNLLHNAIKFSHPNSSVMLRITRENNQIVIRVTDKGKGMSQERAARLFRGDFYSTQGTQGESGTGVGTQIIKEFATQNNGKLEVKSQPNHGTSITLTLPITTS